MTLYWLHAFILLPILVVVPPFYLGLGTLAHVYDNTFRDTWRKEWHESAMVWGCYAFGLAPYVLLNVLLDSYWRPWPVGSVIALVVLAFGVRLEGERGKWWQYAVMAFVALAGSWLTLAAVGFLLGRDYSDRKYRERYHLGEAT